MYVFNNDFSGRCIRMRPRLDNQCYAISELVRPWEVAGLIQMVPPWMLPRGHTFASEVAGWLHARLRNGMLRYIPDLERPSGYDYWCTPSATLERGGGDCDDLSILVASLLLAGYVDAWAVVGTIQHGRRVAGHVWVEGFDDRHGFLIEATSGDLFRYVRPPQYRANLFLGPGCCERVA